MHVMYLVQLNVVTGHYPIPICNSQLGIEKPAYILQSRTIHLGVRSHTPRMLSAYHRKHDSLITQHGSAVYVGMVVVVCML